MPSIVRAAGAVAAAGAACVAYGTLIESRWFRVVEHTIPGVLKAPGARLTILHLADVHLAPPQQHRVDFLKGLVEHDYDLVVATGDLLGAVGAEDALVDALTPLTADGTPGLVTLGSNDLYGPTPKSPHLYFTDPDARRYGQKLDTERMIRGLADAGYRTLRNETTTVETGVGTVAVGGLDDPHLETTILPPPNEVAVPVDDAVLDLGLVHAPYTHALDLLVDAGYDVLLAGHTHGGQVRFPPIGAVVGNCDLPLEKIRGLSEWHGRPLHVTAGVGHSKYAPFRFCCRPEAALLHLTG